MTNSFYYNLKVKKEKKFDMMIKFSVEKKFIIDSLNQFSKTLDINRIKNVDGFTLPENSYGYFDNYLKKLIPLIEKDLVLKNKIDKIHYYSTYFAGIQKETDRIFSIQLQVKGLVK